MTRRTGLLAIAGLVAIGGLARADDTPPFVPQGLPQQGRLLDSNDNPVTGQVAMTFNLYHQATGGTAVWTEQQTVQVDNGYYAIVLGDPSQSGVQPITTDDLAGPTWLGVTIGANEMQPRLQLGTVPYAQRADLANRMLGGTIDGATITNSSVDATQVTVGGQTVIDGQGNVDATSLSIGGNTVIDSSGNLNGKPMSDYVTNEQLTQNYTDSTDLAGQEFDNEVRNGSFEQGQAGALPSYWDAVGGGNGTRGQVADPLFGANALEISDSDNAQQVAAQQVVIPASEIVAYAGDTFTASVWAKRKNGTSHGRLCIVEGDGASAPMDCADLSTDSTYTRAVVSHVVGSSASYLAVLLDSGSAPGDANDYVFDGVMLTRGKLAPAFSPNMAEQVAGELPDQSVPDSALPADVALLDAPSDAFTGDLSAKSFTGSGSGLTGVPDAALTANIPRLDAATNAFTGDLSAKSFTGSGAGLTGVPDGALSSNIPKLDAATNAFTGSIGASAFTGDGSGLTNISDAALSPNIPRLDAATNTFDGSISATSFTGSGSGLSGIPDGALSSNVALLDAKTDAFAGDLSAKSFTGSGSGLTGIPDGALSSNVPKLNASGNAFTGALSASSLTGSGAGLTNLNAAQVTGTFGSVTSSGSVTAPQGAFTSVTLGTAGGTNGSLQVNGTIRAQQLCDATGANCKTVSQGWDPPPAIVQLTDAPTITVDASRGYDFEVTLGGDHTLANPTGLGDGRFYTFRIKQDATGGWKLTWGSHYVFSGNSIPATAAGALSIATFVSDGTNLYNTGGYNLSGIVPFNFTNASGVAVNAVVTSNAVTLSGISGAVLASITGPGSPELSVNGGSWAATATVQAGDTLTVRATSSTSVSTTTSELISVGGYATSWSITTTTNPSAFGFTDVTNAALSTVVTSSPVTPTGYTGTVPVSVSGDGGPQISVNGGAWGTSGTMAPGQTLTVRLTSAATVSTSSKATVVAGSYSTTWTVTTTPCAGGTVSYSSPGSTSVTIPTGCTHATATLAGAGGGGGGHGSDDSGTGGSGGSGGYVAGTFTTTPGSTLFVWVGGGGIAATPCGGGAGTNGGGGPGAAPHCGDDGSGGGGGGYSAISTSSSASSGTVMVAAGGGGGGGTGDAGGGGTGGSGGSTGGNGSSAGGGGGAGATTSGGGSCGSYCGSNGSSFQGGSGGNGSGSYPGGGGGGGGGFYGGGGGGGSGGSSGGGGGGGGANWVAGSVTGVTNNSSGAGGGGNQTNGSNGSISITWQP